MGGSIRGSLRLLARDGGRGGGSASGLRDLRERVRAKDLVVIWGKYLLGLTHDDAVLPLGRNLEYLCSTAWILGLRAASDSRYEEAADWLQVSVEAGAAMPTAAGGEPGGAMYPAYGSSAETLWSWTDAKRFLAGVAAEGIL